MGWRWRYILPVAGLMAFGIITVREVQWNRSYGLSSRYFWWAGVRLGKTPQPQRFISQSTLYEGGAECVAFDPEFISVQPGILPRILILAAMPAFVFGAGVIALLERAGVLSLHAFMVVMPPLITVWFFLVGCLLDRRALYKIRLSA
ncbi:MAG: hypothetical protein JNL62_05100 [Bryobacterales bacterium]|nr:hypothetical protein [Bryobacterales bacterium]